MVSARTWRGAARLLALAVCVRGAAAQVPPGVAPPTDTAVLDAVPSANGPADARWRLGKDALQAGDAAAALLHLLAVLEFHPASPPVLADIVRAAADPGVRALWLDRWVRAAIDAQGRCEPDAALKKVLAADALAAPKRLASLRSQAAAELARTLDRCKPTGKAGLGNGAIARWLATAFVELCGDAPALLRQHGPAFAAALQRGAPEWDLVCKGLLQVAQGRFPAATTGADADAEAERRRRADLALRAARLLAGLARQGSFGKDLQGQPAPDLSGYVGPAAAAAAAAVAAFGPAHVHTIDELRAFDAAARDAFTLAHRSHAAPGICLSTTGKYRIETVCGYETLLGAAETVELHHARLVAHYGSDPFVDRQGTVVIVPEVADLESEGAPMWWVQGFQGGDRTVVRFAWGRISELGHLLTHELTHRFDGVLRPFQRPWYAEGHASWTGGHYGEATETDFTADHLDVGACVRTLGAGYGAEANLEKLLLGDLEDYRDNYFAGYALYAFLRDYPPKDKPRFQAQLARFEQNARGGQKDPVGYFTKQFCDGKDGRPADFAGFVAQWNEFLTGCARWSDDKTRGPENAWVGRYGKLPEAKPTPLVLDEPTWSWGRTRAEPFFGQGHAGAAGAVLAAAGLRDAAAAAYLWSLQCEGWQPLTAEAAVDALRQLGSEDAASALQMLAAQRFPARIDALPAPAIAARLPKLRAYVDALEANAAALPAAAAIAAAALRGERASLQALCGGGDSGALAALPPPPVPRALGASGFVEDSLTDFDDNGVANLWFTTPEGDLHVGREKPRSSTGSYERQAIARDAYVRSSDWLPPGEHVVRVRIHFTTSFVSGAVVIGHWRRDRGIRLSFSAGNHAYAVGRSEDAAEFDRVWMSLRGLWERDGQLPETAPFSSVVFPEPASSFALELRLRGPSLVVAIDGEDRFRYTTPDGAPIEGYLGFASSQGAYRVQLPTVQRLDRCQPGLAPAAVAAVGLDVARQPTVAIEELEHRPTRGLPVGPVGTLVLWLPRVPDGEDPTGRLPRAIPALAKLLKDRLEYPQPWVLAVPAGTAAAIVDGAQQQLAEVRGEPLPLVEHQVGAPLTGNPWVLFVDAAGILRAAGQLGDPRLHSAVQKWARLFRAR